MTPFSDIDAKRLKRLTQQMNDFADVLGINNPVPWEPWFAWHPVKVHGHWTWLKTVYRKPVWAMSDTFNTYYAYGTILDILRDAQ